MKEKRGSLIGGLILVGLGLVALVSQFVNFPALDNLAIYFVAALGAIFLLVGVFTREAGWMIPGGILSGIGWGIVAIEGPNSLISGSGDVDGGVFMLIFAGGWVLITLFTALFTDETHWWALIPGGIIALVGTAVLWGGPFMNILEFVGKAWPVALIILGIYILLHANRSQEKEPEDLIKQVD